MEQQISNSEISNKIRHYGRSLSELKQVRDRLKALLESRVLHIADTMDISFSITKRERLALAHDDYKLYIEEYIEVVHSYNRTRVAYDSYQRLLAARRSIASFRRKTENYWP